MQISPADQAAIDRFCHQMLQLEPSPDLPGPALIRRAEVQDQIYRRLFGADAPAYGPPVKYQIRMLEKLLAEIEASIDDWDQDVSFWKECTLYIPATTVWT